MDDLNLLELIGIKQNRLNKVDNTIVKLKGVIKGKKNKIEKIREALIEKESVFSKKNESSREALLSKNINILDIQKARYKEDESKKQLKKINADIDLKKQEVAADFDKLKEIEKNKNDIYVSIEKLKYILEQDDC